MLFLNILFKKKDKNISYNKIIEFENMQNISQIEIQEFRKINSENLLLDKTKYKKVDQPDISIIVTNYNQAHCIYKCIRSIQNQSLKNLEIIIIDDCSLDNSIEIIESFQKEDNRIILLKHESNEGKIKTRSDGIKIAKGKYITIIDGDDSFIHKNILFNSFYISKIADLDIVEFRCSIFLNGRNIGHLYDYDLFNATNIIYQPELRTKFFFTKDVDSMRAIQCRNICFKLIRKKILKKTLKYIGKKFTDDYIMDFEDTIMAVAIMQIAHSYYLMKQDGYYYSKDDYSNNIIILKNKKCQPNGKEKTIGQLKLLQFLVEKTRNNKKERQLLYHEIISMNYYSKFADIIKVHSQFEFMNNVYDILINSKFISEKQKEKIKLLKIQLKLKEK